MKHEYRVISLYRQCTGRTWWLQYGWWFQTNGPMGMWTGRPKKKFHVTMEWCYGSKAKAMEAKANWEARN